MELSFPECPLSFCKGWLQPLAADGILQHSYLESCLAPAKENKQKKKKNPQAIPFHQYSSGKFT